ncbi:MAG: hypothetical protein LBG09_02260 [Puniceicoccales bacterium]|jgi:hypothetical protein|nr:hypothetical protein [Puniceicoccales bacterium]
MKTNVVRKRQVLYGVASLLAGGCASLGPRAVKQTHYEYNTAIAKITDEQVLLNLVRLKYRDMPYFLEVGNVSESRKFTTRIGPSGSKFGIIGNANKHEIGLLAYSEIFQNPTIQYTPLKGEDFTKRLMTPIPLTLVLGLMQAGWKTKRVFNICVERLNQLDNASSASGPTPNKKPNNQSFAEAVDLIDTLHKQNRLLLGLAPDNGNDFAMKFTSSDAQSQRLKSILGLDANTSEFRFDPNFLNVNATGPTVRTRSLMEVLFYLSHAVDVPQEDIDAGLVTVTKDEQGNPFDWSKSLSGEWIAIRHAEQQPQNAFVSIAYKGTWFYIADDDLNAKSTFMFLNYLLNLLSGNPKSVAPVLTISAN